jgi:hypothetical protein
VEPPRPRGLAERRNTQIAIFSFIIFVDGMFTTLFERLFTKVFDAETQTTAPRCVYLARHAD